MVILRYITITLDIIFLVLIGFFVRDLRWSNPDHRGSIVGFGYMMGTLAMNIFLVAML